MLHLTSFMHFNRKLFNNIHDHAWNARNHIKCLYAKNWILQLWLFQMKYSKTCVNDHSQTDRKLIFKTNYRLMQVKSIAECSHYRLMQVKRIAECSQGSILQYFRPSLSYHLSLRSLFCLFLSGRFAQVLPYLSIMKLHKFQMKWSHM